MKPEYTEDARRQGIEGEGLMQMVVARDGRVRDIRVITGLGYGLDERAMDAVRRWQFAPGLLRGTPVDVLVDVAVEFRIR